MTGTTSKTTTATVIIVAIGALLLAVAALIGNSEEIDHGDSFDFRPADYDTGAAVVVSKRVRQGMKLLGITFREPEYHVNVAFAVPGGECFFALAGQETWPVPDASCANPHHLSGMLSGLGTTAEGATYVGVELTVEAECHNNAELGMEWSKVDSCG